MKTRAFTFALLLALSVVLSLGQTGGHIVQASQLPAVLNLFSPELTSITPSQFENMVNMRVTITGNDLSTVTSALLGTVELRNLKVVSATEIAALVPWFIEPGTYDLTVKSPSAPDAVLTAAVTVGLGSTEWTSNGPYGGDLWDLVVDPTDSTRLFVSAGRSGLWLTTDSAASWYFSNPFPFTDRAVIAYDSADQPVIYLDDQRSLDYGETWEDKEPDEFNAIFSDGGGAEASPFTRPDQPDWVYFGVSTEADPEPRAGLYFSTNRGDSWSKIESTSGLHVTALAFDPDQPNHLILGTDDGKIYRSTDNGATWGDPIAVTNFIGRLEFSPTLYGGERSLWAIDAYPHDYATDSLYRSTDGGQTWEPVPVSAGFANYDLAMHDTIPGLLWAASRSGYYSEDNGTTWHSVGFGLDEVQSVAVIPGAASRQTTTVFAATRYGMFKSTDGGGTWAESHAGLGANLARTIAISPFNADEAYAATLLKKMMHTYDGGRSWQTLSVPIGGYDASVATDPFTDGKVYFGSDQGIPSVRVSEDHGLTYETYTMALPGAYSGREAMVRLTPDPVIEGRLLAGLCLGNNPPEPGFIYASDDGGQTWVQQTTPANINCVMSHLVFDPGNPNMVYAGSQNLGLMRSTDGGATWNFLEHQPAGTQILSIAVDPQDSDSIYISSFGGPLSDVGIFATHDGGDTWVKMTGTSIPIWQLKFVKVGTDYWLYAATMNSLDYLPIIPANPSAPWIPASGIAGVAATDGFNAATEDGRVVYYIGTSGGRWAGESAVGGNSIQSAASQNFGGGIYRSLTPDENLLENQGWALRYRSGAGEGVTALEVFDGKLYAGSSSWEKGGQIWRTANGTDWETASEPGISADYGADNPAILDLVTFKDHLYAAVGWGAIDGQIWRTGPDLQWSKVTDGEFYGQESGTPTVMIVFKDRLYTFPSAGSGTTETWRSSTGDPGSWEKVLPDGFGNPNLQYVAGAAILNGILYVSAGNTVDGMQVWQTGDGTQWTQSNSSGFGSSTRQSAQGMATLNGYIYTGTQDPATGGEVWRSDGSAWTRVVAGGFGDARNTSIMALFQAQNRLFAIARNDTTGLQVWTSLNGTQWKPLNQEGFGNRNNNSLHWSNSSSSFANSYFVGTWYGDIWQYQINPTPVYLPLIKQ